MAYLCRETCPACDKKGLGNIFPCSTGGYRQCQYCNRRVAAAEALIIKSEQAPTMVGKQFHIGQQKVTVMKVGRTLLTVQFGDGSLGRFYAADLNSTNFVEA